MPCWRGQSPLRVHSGCYASSKTSWLHCAKRDATALHALFTDTLGTGTHLLTDEQATKAAIEDQFLRIAQCSPDDVVVISFSCHGTRTHEIATYDADPNDLPNTAIPLNLLGTWFARIPARRLLCIIDSCFAGGIGAKVFIPDSSVPQNQPSVDPFDQLSGDGRLVITSTAATEPAWEIGKFSHGLLTFYLLEALQGAEEVLAAGKISIYRLLDYVTRRVFARNLTSPTESRGCLPDWKSACLPPLSRLRSLPDRGCRAAIISNL
jgi:helicase